MPDFQVNNSYFFYKLVEYCYSCSFVPAMPYSGLRYSFSFSLGLILIKGTRVGISVFWRLVNIHISPSGPLTISVFLSFFTSA